ncbi:MAG: hypothetical protein ACFFCD_11715 [Promethearchaeota archaeon]
MSKKKKRTFREMHREIWNHIDSKLRKESICFLPSEIAKKCGTHPKVIERHLDLSCDKGELMKITSEEGRSIYCFPNKLSKKLKSKRYIKD